MYLVILVRPSVLQLLSYLSFSVTLLVNLFPKSILIPKSNPITQVNSFPKKFHHFRISGVRVSRL